MDIIAKIVEVQKAGGLICPRCGRMSMDKVLSHNALSRVADVYVCPDCGMDEAIRDFGRIPLPVEEWALPQLWKNALGPDIQCPCQGQSHC